MHANDTIELLELSKRLFPNEEDAKKFTTLIDKQADISEKIKSLATKDDLNNLLTKDDKIELLGRINDIEKQASANFNKLLLAMITLSTAIVAILKYS